MRLSLVLTVLMAVARGAPAECTVWRGFEPPVQHAAAGVQAVLIADLDNDRAADVIASGNHVEMINAFSVFRNRGNGGFDAERVIPAGNGQQLQGAGDLNGDGIVDLVAADYWANGIATYAGIGGLNFGGAVAYGTATHGGPTLLVDFDRDARLDVISFSFGSGNPVRVHRFRGNGDGTLASKITTDTSWSVAARPSLRVRNGTFEILAGDRSGSLSITRIEGDVVSVTPFTAGPGFDLSSAFGDVNADGVADIVDTDDSASPHESIFVTLANGDGTFRERGRLAHPRQVDFPVEVRVADLDSDRNADVVVADFRRPSLFLFRGDGAGNFGAGLRVDAGGPVNTFAIADLNGDAQPDIVTANNDHTLSVLLNRGGCRPPRSRTVRQ